MWFFEIIKGSSQAFLLVFMFIFDHKNYKKTIENMIREEEIKVKTMELELREKESKIEILENLSEKKLSQGIESKENGSKIEIELAKLSEKIESLRIELKGKKSKFKIIIEKLLEKIKLFVIKIKLLKKLIKSKLSKLIHHKIKNKVHGSSILKLKCKFCNVFLLKNPDNNLIDYHCEICGTDYVINEPIGAN